MEEHVAQEASHSEREQDVSKVITCLLGTAKAEVHGIDHEDGHNRNEGCRYQGLCQEWQRTQVPIDIVESSICTGGLYDLSKHFDVPVAAVIMLVVVAMIVTMAIFLYWDMSVSEARKRCNQNQR